MNARSFAPPGLLPLVLPVFLTNITSRGAEDPVSGGIQLFHGQFGGPWPGVDPQIKCLSAPWDSAVRHVGDECRRLGLDLTLQNCPGWAMAGGPWITPENAMRQLVWSRTYLTGGGSAAILPKPDPGAGDWRDYRDIAVVAFPCPEGDTGSALTPVSVRGNPPDRPWRECLAGSAGGRIHLPPAGDPGLVDSSSGSGAIPAVPGSEPNRIEVSFAEPVMLRTVELPAVQTYNHGWCYDPGVAVTVEALENDAVSKVAAYTLPPGNWQESEPISLACAEHPAKTYRISIRNLHPMDLSGLRLLSVARLSNWEASAAFDLRGPIRDPRSASGPDTDILGRAVADHRSIGQDGRGRNLALAGAAGKMDGSASGPCEHGPPQRPGPARGHRMGVRQTLAFRSRSPLRRLHRTPDIRRRAAGRRPAPGHAARQLGMWQADMDPGNGGTVRKTPRLFVWEIVIAQWRMGGAAQAWRREGHDGIDRNVRSVLPRARLTRPPTKAGSVTARPESAIWREAWLCEEGGLPVCGNCCRVAHLPGNRLESLCQQGKMLPCED